MAQRARQGHPVSPVRIEGRAIAKTFWGKAWCENLEGYSDYANRLPRGRTYVRNGSVIDLQIACGEVKARVSGSDLYEVCLRVSALPKTRWKSIVNDCAGAIDSLVELLQGRFSAGVMQRLCQPKAGLFPAPSEIQLSCSCPDWALMCKHVAAVLYGIGARLDMQPELLFKLRSVDEKDLIASAGRDLPLSKKGPAASRVLADDDLCALFDVDLAGEAHGAGKRKLRARKPTKGKSLAARGAGATGSTRARSAATRPAANKSATAISATSPRSKARRRKRTRSLG
jgi:uncharacterized Zn finger protein